MGLKRNFYLHKQIVNLVALFVTTVLSSCDCIVHPDGESTVSRYQDDLGNYQFGYNIASSDGEHFHKAGTDALGRVVGSYGMTLADGRRRMVDYVADKNGFRAHVRSNEPGMMNAQAADVVVEKSDGPAFLPEPQRLELAASDSKSSDTNAFGERLQHTSSWVAYVRPDENEEHRRGNEDEEDEENVDDEEGQEGDLEESVKDDNDEVRLEPVGRDELSFEGSKTFEQDSVSPTSDYSRSSPDLSAFRLPDLNFGPAPRDNNDRVSLRGRYNPPLDPNTAMKPTGFRQSFNRQTPESPLYTTHHSSSPEPSTPPYGGFNFPPSFLTNDNDFDDYIDSNSYRHSSRPSHSHSHNEDYDSRYPLTIPPSFSYNRQADYPPVTMSTVHGGYAGRYPYTSSPRPQEVFGARINRYPSRRPYPTTEVYPSNYGRPSVPVDAGQRFPTSSPPKPNLILRAVAIPNGIQAVHVDPATGRTHDNSESRGLGAGTRTYDYNDQRHVPVEPNRKIFPEFPVYKNPLSLTPVAENSPSHAPGSFRNSPSPHTYQQIAPKSKKRDDPRLNKPSSKDLALIARVFEHVNNHQRNGVPPDPYHFNSHPFQPDPPPDYPQLGDTHSRPRTSSGTIRDYNVNEGPRQQYIAEPKDFPEVPTRVHRPSVAVRLPGFDEPNYRNSREYRSAPSNKNATQKTDEIIHGDDDKSLPLSP